MAGGFILPIFSVQKTSINPILPALPAEAKPVKLEGKQVPLFKLPTTEGRQIHPVDLLGKPTLLTFVTSWSPAASEQLPALAELQENQDLNVYPVSILEGVGKIRAYQKSSGYNLDFIVDKDGTTVEGINLQSLPTHVFVSRQGIIKKVVVGVLLKKEIVTNLVGL